MSPENDDERETRAQLLGQYRDWLDAAAGLAPTTITSYTAHTAGYLHWLAEKHPTTTLAQTQRNHVEGYLSALAARGCAGATRRVALHALRSFYRWQRPDTGTLDPAAATRRPRSRPPLTASYSEAEADTILAAAAPTGGADRSAREGLRAGLEPAVLATLRWAGLRAGELCAQPLSGLDLDAQLLTVIGKGTKQRTITLPDILTAHLDHYLHEVRPTLADSPLLFTNPYGQQGGQPLTGRALLDLCRSAGANASITGPHTALRWRHTYASLSLARGVDLYVVSRLLGHARVETTQRYLHLDTGALSDAIRRAYP
jgi:site-specific recombinase XerD